MDDCADRDRAKILAGELADVIAAICAGVAYANVHTLSPGGEIRGQIKASDEGLAGSRGAASSTSASRQSAVTT
ncbi:MAG: hypothetical protein DMF93_12425 [Acidobacteria bacterium]|nr:MAG: hypothetical protein DMF93_12425 [Acidobacteriota bacterium]